VPDADSVGAVTVDSVIRMSCSADNELHGTARNPGRINQHVAVEAALDRASPGPVDMQRLTIADEDVMHVRNGTPVCIVTLPSIGIHGTNDNVTSINRHTVT
jgi:hypothetical protein